MVFTKIVNIGHLGVIAGIRLMKLFDAINNLRMYLFFTEMILSLFQLESYFTCIRYSNHFSPSCLSVLTLYMIIRSSGNVVIAIMIFATDDLIRDIIW